jgi:predicted dehydrogenase
VARYGIGLLGCGRISENHLRGYRRPEALDGLGEIVALCDVQAAALAQQATRYDVAVRYERLEDLAADPRVDVVTVLTPPDVRRTVVIPLLEAGKHVLVEKPFAETLSEAREMVDAAAANGRRLAVNQNYRWRADTLKMKELIGAGAIGQVVGMHQLHATWRDEGPGWRQTTDYLAMSVMAVHWLDRFRWLARSDAATVYAAARTTGLLQSRGEDWAAITTTLQNGVIAHVTEDWVSSTRRQRSLFLVDGTEGSLVADAPATTVTRYGREAGDEERYDVRGDFPATFAHSMRLLLQAITEGVEPVISGRDNLGTMALLDGAYRSAASGQVVRLEGSAHGPPGGLGAAGPDTGGEAGGR